MTDACTMLRELVDQKYGDRTKVLIHKAAKAAGLEYFRARAIWYGYARRIEQHEYEQIKSAHIKRHLKVARDVRQELDSIISSLEGLLCSTDEEFRRPHIDALRNIRGKIS